jgi:hypothetical protein
MQQPLIDDGLSTPIVGDWAEEKCRLVECYAQIFATSMKRKWDARVYIDLFSGSGRAHIRGTSRIVETAGMRALRITDPFDRYIFCELDGEKLEALRKRVAVEHAGVDVHFVAGDSNSTVSEILSHVPEPNARRKVLTFCFVDPYQLKNLRFETIRQLSKIFVDFLVLIPTGMDPGRNERTYNRSEDQTVEQFTGRTNWRLSRHDFAAFPFGDFVALQLGESMRELQYLFGGLADTHEMRNTKKRTPIYRLAVFSRHDLGPKFWEACRRYTSSQGSLF